jgi:hypothetical protein
MRRRREYIVGGRAVDLRAYDENGQSEVSGSVAAVDVCRRGLTVVVLILSARLRSLLTFTPWNGLYRLVQVVNACRQFSSRPFQGRSSPLRMPHVSPEDASYRTFANRKSRDCLVPPLAHICAITLQHASYSSANG